MRRTAFLSLALGLFLATNAAAQSLVERGKYLGEGIGGCGNCHTPRTGPAQGRALAGGEEFGGGGAPFTSYAANISPDPETGIGKWTDEQIIAAIRDGLRPDGTRIGPPMPTAFFVHFSDNDVKALVAWLRSVPPVSNKVTKSVYNTPLRPTPPAGAVADTSQADKLKYGEYLAQVGHCMECHTPQVRGVQDMVNAMGSGGRKFAGPWGETISANITPDSATGLGRWTDAQITRTLTKGISANDAQLRPPMCFSCYDKMTPDDVGAIVAFLRTIKPVAHDVLAP